MNKAEMDYFLDTLPVLTEARGEDERHLQELIHHPGLKVFLGLIFGSRQGLYGILSKMRLGDEDTRHRASVIQGQIQGLELTIETVREQAVPSSAEDEGKDS